MAIAQNFPNIAPSLDLSFALTKKLDPRISFSRASSATYYGTQTAKAEENLFQYSQEFDNAYWAKETSTVIANTIASPDGASTADTLTANAGAGLHRIRYDSMVVTSSVYTVSIFAKKNTADWLLIREGLDGSTVNSSFNLDTGSVGTVGAGRSASIQDVGNGWYRCITTVTATAGTKSITFCVATADNTQSYIALGTESIFVWGAQLEARSAPTAYTATTTQPITNYIPVLQTASANVARFDHDPVTGESLGLLVEEQRTNLFLRSEEFDNSYWTKTRASIMSNAIVAPDGTLTGDKLIEDTQTGSHYVSKVFTGTAVQHTESIYFKAAETQFAYINLFDGTSTVGAAYFNLSAGTVGTVLFGSASIQSVGNGWYRCSVTATLKISTACQAAFYSAVSDGTLNYTGDGYSGIYIWGAQLEAGAFPTSYIKTEASQVTRSADSASMTGANFSSWYRQDEGTVYMDIERTGLTSSFASVFDINNGTAAQRLSLGSSVTDKAQGASIVNNVAQTNISSINDISSGKAMFAYKINDFALSCNSATSITASSGLLPVVTQLNIGQRGDGGNIYTGTIKKLAYYPVKLEPDQLQALTS